MRKKVLHIITGMEVGGAEMNLVRLIPALNVYHDNIVCCLTTEGPVSALLREQGIPLVHLGAKKTIIDFLRPSLIRKFRTLIRHEKPDLIITYLIHADLFGRFWGKFFDVPRIFSWNRGSLLGWQWLSFFDRLTSFLVDCYIFQTQAMRTEISKVQHIPIAKTMVIANVVNFNSDSNPVNRQELLRGLGISHPSFPTIICVANLRKGKGHPVLIRAFTETLKKTGPANLLIVGEGEQRPLLEALAQQSTAAHSIFFLGHQSNVPALLQASDIFVLPTFYEGMSNAILEALLSGCPVITTDIPVNRDVIKDGHSGLLVPVRNISLLATALETLILSPERRQSLQEAGRTFVQTTCAPDVIAKKLSGLILKEN